MEGAILAEGRETSGIPARIPATSNDLATSVVRDLGQHMEIALRLSFDTHLDAEVLRRAVRLSLDAEPVLGCGLRTSFRSGWWERRDDLDVAVPFSLADTADADADAARAQVAPIPDEGPQVRVTLLRSADRDDLVADLSHNVADGQSVKQYGYVLADLYTRLAADPAYLPQPDLSPRPEGLDVWESLSAEERAAAKKAPRPVMPNWELPRKAATGRGRTLRELRLPQDRLAALRTHGKSLDATVNDMLLTAFFRALLAAHPQSTSKPLSLAFAAEHRRYLKSEAEPPIGNLAITIWLGVEPTPGETFDETLARVVEMTGRARESHWGLASGVGAARLAKLGPGPTKFLLGGVAKLGGSGKTSPVFTNIGVLDESRLSFAGSVPADGRMSGPAAFGASFVPTISTYRETLTVSMGFCDQDIDPADVENVLQTMERELTF
jgi:NRPS condensation-like uncharacterized protein